MSAPEKDFYDEFREALKSKITQQNHIGTPGEGSSSLEEDDDEYFVFHKRVGCEIDSWYPTDNQNSSLEKPKAETLSLEEIRSSVSESMLEKLDKTADAIEAMLVENLADKKLTLEPKNARSRASEVSTGRKNSDSKSDMCTFDNSVISILADEQRMIVDDFNSGKKIPSETSANASASLSAPVNASAPVNSNLFSSEKNPEVTSQSDTAYISIIKAPASNTSFEEKSYASKSIPRRETTARSHREPEDIQSIAPKTIRTTEIVKQQLIRKKEDKRVNPVFASSAFKTAAEVKKKKRDGVLKDKGNNRGCLKPLLPNRSIRCKEKGQSNEMSRSNQQSMWGDFAETIKHSYVALMAQDEDKSFSSIIVPECLTDFVERISSVDSDPLSIEEVIKRRSLDDRSSDSLLKCSSDPSLLKKAVECENGSVYRCEICTLSECGCEGDDIESRISTKPTYPKDKDPPSSS